MNLATLAFGIAFSIMFFGFFFYMTDVWHYTLPQAGLAITPGPLLVIPVAILSGGSPRGSGTGRSSSAAAWSTPPAGCGSCWCPARKARTSRSGCPGSLMSGIGVGLVLPSLAAAAVNRLPADQYAVGSAVNQATRQIGSVMGVAITVLLLGHGGLTHASFVPLYACHVALALLTALLCLPVNTRPQTR